MKSPEFEETDIYFDVTYL